MSEEASLKDIFEIYLVRQAADAAKSNSTFEGTNFTQQVIRSTINNLLAKPDLKYSRKEILEFAATLKHSIIISKINEGVEKFASNIDPNNRDEVIRVENLRLNEDFQTLEGIRGTVNGIYNEYVSGNSADIPEDQKEKASTQQSIQKGDSYVTDLVWGRTLNILDHAINISKQDPSANFLDQVLENFVINIPTFKFEQRGGMKSMVKMHRLMAIDMVLDNFNEAVKYIEDNRPEDMELFTEEQISSAENLLVDGKEYIENYVDPIEKTNK